jgi:ABC-type phosphate/phosphonate transport system substrate-binding protein
VVPATSPARQLSDLRGTACAINDACSHSGTNALRALVAPLAEDGRFFRSIRRSGGHRNSLDLLAAGEVDVAAIDCVTYALLMRVAPSFRDKTRILGETAATPAPVYVVRRDRPGLRDKALAALRRVMGDPSLRSARESLHLAGIEELPESAYGCFVEIEAQAARLGYPTLA